MYAADRADPILRAWTAAFPGLFEPISRMPPGIRARLRYPPGLFNAQAELYQQFHITGSAEFASGADAWAMPISLSGPVDVAGDIRFDSSDEDDLRYRMRPGYRFAAPGGEGHARLLLSAFYSPRGAQNLVASLDGYIDRSGRPRMVSPSLPRDRVTLGPAQVSRLVNNTPRVANSLGTRNLELRDVGKSSIDAIWLGNPHIMFLAGGIMQVQPIYDASNSRGVARMYGITVWLNGRAGLGHTLRGAVRQALHLPPTLKLGEIPESVVAGRPVPIHLQVGNGRTETIRIWSKKGTQFSKRVWVGGGPASVEWVPKQPGHVRVRVLMRGQDGSLVTRTTATTVEPPPKPKPRKRDRDGEPTGRPTVQFTALPKKVVLGRPVDIRFKVTNGVRETVRVESGKKDALTWELRVTTGQGGVEWVPRQAGRTRLRIVVLGAHGRTVEAATDLIVSESRTAGN